MQFVIARVPKDKVDQICMIQTEAGATKCERKDNGDGTFDVLVKFPDPQN